MYVCVCVSVRVGMCHRGRFCGRVCADRVRAECVGAFVLARVCMRVHACACVLKRVCEFLYAFRRACARTDVGAYTCTSTCGGRACACMGVGICSYRYVLACVRLSVCMYARVCVCYVSERGCACVCVYSIERTCACNDECAWMHESACVFEYMLAYGHACSRACVPTSCAIATCPDFTGVIFVHKNSGTTTRGLQARSRIIVELILILGVCILVNLLP